MKSGNLNFLEPSGPLQDCNGTALPIYDTKIKINLKYDAAGGGDDNDEKLRRATGV